MTVDPSSLLVTNRFDYSGMTKILSDGKTDDQFSFDYDMKNFVFRSTNRPQLLCQLYECIHKKLPLQLKSHGPFNAKRLKKNGVNIDCKLSVAAFGVMEYDLNEKILQEYKFFNISRCGVDEKSSVFFIEVEGRIKIFLSENYHFLLTGFKELAMALSLKKEEAINFSNLLLKDLVFVRNTKYSSIGTAVSMFEVSKITKRSSRPVPRQMHINEEYILEKGSSGFQNCSFQKVSAVYAIVRSWVSPREFTIEYDNGTSRTYSSAVRDTLLATLLDVCHAVGNVKVIITGEVSDNLRLMPRHTDEKYQSSIKDNFFGVGSIEAWLLGRLISTCKIPHTDSRAIVLACAELNANVPCPGIAPNTDLNQVRGALVGVLTTLHYEVAAALSDELLDNSRFIVTLLQTLYRVIPCVHGYKSFLEVKEIDTRLLYYNYCS